MISLALRLAIRGAREAAARAVFIALGVALGVVLLVTAFASYHALRAEDARSGWLATAAHNRDPSANEATTDPIGWRKTTDAFDGLPIVRVEVAATGSRSPRLPGMAGLPGPGQFYASPAMATLLTATPTDQLGNRYPGRQVGTIGRAALATPNALVIVIGRSSAQLAAEQGAVMVHSIETAPAQHSYTTFQEVALGIGAAGLLFPTLTFVAMATRIAAARREQRLAAMRLVGATIRQIAFIAAIEAATAALVGTVAGIGLFFALRSEIAGLKVTGDGWFASDLSPGAPALAIVCIAVPLAAGLAAVASLRRVRLSPLGVSRRATPPPPTRARLIPLGLGLLVLAVFALAGRTYSRGASGSYAPTIVAGFVLMMAGIIVGGPWLTMAATKLLAMRSTRGPSLIASRRLADNPAAAFR
ncbi:MAG TPA: FtsX-like permease family protein, partial [Acidothermaceae bacterium]